MTDAQKQEHFLHLFEQIRAPLWRFIRALTHSREDADDLMSETILKVYERLHTINNYEATLSFVFTIARRIYKRQMWRKRLFGSFDDTYAEMMRDRSTPPDISPDVQALYAALERLPEKERETVALFELSGFSLEEIRVIQGGSLSGVKSRLRRGRHHLAELLGADHSGELRETDNHTYTDTKLSDSSQHFLFEDGCNAISQANTNLL